MNPLIQRIRQYLRARYGARFAGVVLYGSEARGDAHAGSDLDLLVLLHGSFDYFDELRAIIDVLYPLQLESDRLISARPARVEEFEAGRLQLYRNARCEGVLLGDEGTRG